VNILIGVDSVKYPMSGIGVYSYNLCKQYLQRPDLNVTGLTRFKLLSSDGLKQHLRDASDAHRTEGLIDRVSLGRQFKRTIKDSFIARSVYHSSARVAAHINLRKLSQNTVYHVPNFIGYGYSEKKVVTVHDLSHIDCAGMHPQSRVRFMKDKLSKSLCESKAVIVDSDFTAARLLESGLIEKNREHIMHRVHLGVSDDFVPLTLTTDGLPSILCYLALRPKGYFLAVGTIEPRKNHQRLLDAYLQLPSEIAAEFPLVICGALGWKFKAFLDRIKAVPKPYSVIMTGHLPQADMRALLAASKALVYPSLYEGFGMPVLEAMKSGVPVITSGLGATLEVSGDAAIHVDPLCQNELSGAMALMVSSSSTADEYIKRGLAQVSKFTWEKCASETLSVYQRI
jgi:glycosyltransferase involved in cell wall biosynthesis